MDNLIFTRWSRGTKYDQKSQVVTLIDTSQRGEQSSDDGQQQVTAACHSHITRGEEESAQKRELKLEIILSYLHRT